MAKTKRKTKEQNLERLQQFLNRMAKKLRGRRTQWEQSLYVTLKNLGYKFEFQKPLICRQKYGYILDFYLEDFHLAIEVDSKKYHSSKEDIKKDNIRTKRLKNEGIHMLRLTNGQVSTYNKEIIDKIIKTKLKIINENNIK